MRRISSISTEPRFTEQMISNSHLEFIGQLFSLSDRTAIITGASRGIGWALADGLARAGVMVFALARSEQPERPLPEGAEYRRCDVRDPQEFERCRDAVVERYGRLDVLVNAAGITAPGSGLEGFEQALATNLRGPYSCICSAAVPMQAAGRGSIINVTSLSAFRGFPNNPAYVATKGGLSQLTRAFAYDLGTAGIRVNNLVPGYIATAMTAASHDDPATHELRRRHTMLGRWGTPSDLVGAVIFLASDASTYVTGQDIVVDGGWLAKGLV